MNPSSVAPLLSLAIGALLFLGLAAAALVSRREEERRAAGRFLLLAVLLPAPFLVCALVPFPGRGPAALALVDAAVAAAVLLVIPLPVGRDPENDTPRSRFDERDTLFNRRRLEPGTERFEEYYRRRPENREPDRIWRDRPGLLAKDSAYHDPVTFAAAEAGFTAVKALRALLDRPEPERERIGIPPARAARFVKEWAKKLGAHSAGVTTLEEYHQYTHIGRGDRYGDRVDLPHFFAIAVTVEMDKAMIDRSPHGPTLMESARRYLESGAIAVQIAEWIRGLGHSARAHIDGDYRVVCPLVARDAGLGEIGRMGILMTPDLGPRVRVAVVTTDMPLLPDPRRREPTTIDFCGRCRKCADACPARAIPAGGKEDRDGVRRWRIDSEACYGYWCSVGTDCARCVKVCPYSHPANALHGLVRWGIRRSPLFLRLALPLDHFFYGRKPPPAPPPEWIPAAGPSPPRAR